jgi:pimeloyl-ACP methyl ester carboxylesterase
MNLTRDLIGCPDDNDLAELLDDRPAAMESLLQDVLGKDEAATATKTLRDRVGRGAAAGLVHPPKIDPSLPEIVLLHGITDCHLANVSGRRNRIWLDYLELIKGRYTKYLPLQPDGRSDQPDVRIETDGPVAKKYGRALQAWRQNGFRAHVYCYDWRKSVFVGGDGLNAFLKSLETVQAGRKVILVCHSMGGLVASSYAARHADWADIVAHCVFVGSPLGGSYSVAEAILGKSPSFQRMDRLSIFETLEDFQHMAASFPGLIDMLPNPEVFPEAADLYSVAGWPGDVQPRQVWLDHSREVKPAVWTSPLFTRSTHLVSQDHATVAALPWNASHDDRDPDVLSPEGDGAVLNRSSLAPGLRSFKVPGEHGLLCTEPQVIAAVEAIARGQSPQLPAISAADLTGSTQPAAARSRAMAVPAGLAKQQVTTQLATALAARLASDGTRGAMLGLTGDTRGHSFDRGALHTNSFSWQNALSLAMASERAYQKTVSVLRDEVLGQWGFVGCTPFDEQDTQGFVAWDEQIVLLSFRGTEQNLADWLSDFNALPCSTEAYGRVHKGFYDGFQIARNAIDAILQTAGASHKKLWLTGHSLGAALAVIAGAEYRDWCSLAGLYTYGQPAVGGEPLRALYQQHYPGRFFRFVNNQDLVPRVPPPPVYRHCGQLIWFNARGEHVERSAAALAAPNATSGELGPQQLSEDDFATLQTQLRAMSQPSVAGAFRLPPSDAQVESQSLFGISIFSDHSIRDGYIPAIAKQF